MAIVLQFASVPASAAEPADSTLVGRGWRSCIGAPVCIGVRTNLLYDAMAAPNLGLEFCLGRGWSVALDGTYMWYSARDKSRMWRIEAAELTCRRYFGCKPFAGWHAGVYGQLLRYDLCLGRYGYLSGGSGTRGKLSYGFGVEGGYTVTASQRVRFDFSLGLGYLGGEYQTFRCEGIHHVWKSTRNRRYFGPTRLAVTFVYVIGKGGCQ